MAKAYIPDVEHGEQIYNEIDKVNGRNVDYNNVGLIISYTWKDFTDLVQYERDNGIAPYYSAMIATNLMKNKFNQKFKHFKDISYFSEQDALSIFWTNNFIQIVDKIKNWDIASGNYFDKYYELYINDAIRATANEINCTINPIAETDEKDNQKKRTVAISLSVEDMGKDEEYSVQDKIIFSAFNASCAEESLNLDSFSSPEIIYGKKMDMELANSDGFYNILKNIGEALNNENNKLVIDKKIAHTFVFMEKFMDGDTKENTEFNSRIAPILSNVFSSAIVQKPVKEKDESEKDGTEQENEQENEDDYEM